MPNYFLMPVCRFQKTILILMLLALSVAGNSQVSDISGFRTPFMVEGIEIYHLTSGPLLRENQSVFIARISQEDPGRFRLDIAFSDTLLKPTSLFAKEAGAVVALNGGFFDVDKGGSVAYLESEGMVIARNRSYKVKWGKTDSLLNGAVIIDYSGTLSIEQAKNDTLYQHSNREKTVLISGPVLLLDGKRVPLENSAFVHKRHPRSCLCTTNDKDILLVAIDGRSENALGMNLEEAGQFLLSLGCRNAINLDGGGSTTLWVNDGTTAGILNHPSDKAGERPVSNVILVRE